MLELSPRVGFACMEQGFSKGQEQVVWTHCQRSASTWNGSC